MGHHQLREQQQDTRDRGREQREAIDRQGAADRAKLAAFYAAQRAQASRS